MTPLHWAVEREYIEVIHVLLDHGADTNATSKFDKTPISLALEHDRLDLVDILQQEREIIGVQAQQQSQANTAELEVATHNLIQLEAEHNSKSSVVTSDVLEQQKFAPMQQPQQRKRALPQCAYRNAFPRKRETRLALRNLCDIYIFRSFKQRKYKRGKN